MSKFLTLKNKNIEPYEAGEQPTDREYIKLNANETSRPPSPEVLKVLQSEKMKSLGFYVNPNLMGFRQAIAEKFKLKPEQVCAGNGSDEVLAFIFMAFFDENSEIAYPDITYPFYKVLTKLYGAKGRAIPLKKDFTIDVDTFIESGCHIVLANPNNPTGQVISNSEIERMLAANNNRLVIIDEAYVDYGNESCIPLIEKYSNLIVVHTMSKSKNLAGAHIGYAMGDESIISDLENVRNSFNPFNLNRMTIDIGIAAIRDNQYYDKCVDEVIELREYLKLELKKMNFKVIETHTNFVFVSHPFLGGDEYNKQLREDGILARHFANPRISNYLRITVGTKEEVEAVLASTRRQYNNLMYSQCKKVQRG
jgi:histidinol-phosphate aminotransferase